MTNELKNRLNAEYPFKTELHAHTLPVSACSEFYPEELIEAYAKTGVHTIVLTNHFTPNNIKDKSKDEFSLEYVDAYEELKKCAEPYGIAVALGIEIRFAENSNDYVLYAVSPSDVREACDYFDRGIERFSEDFRKKGVFISQAHPKRNGITQVSASFLDGYEAYNMHPGHNQRTALAVKEAKADGLIITGGTDFHHHGHEGCCFLRTRERLLTSYDVADALRSGDYLFELGGSLILP